MQRMADSDFAKLDGLTINDAIAKGLITSIGLPGGGFIFNHNNKEVDTRYAVINGKAIACSSSLSEKEQDDIADMLGDLTFQSGMSQEKYKNGQVDPNGDFIKWQRLSMPRGLDLGEAAVKVELEAEPTT